MKYETPPGYASQTYRVNILYDPSHLSATIAQWLHNAARCTYKILRQEISAYLQKLAL